ncbi:MAG: hypothetical protein HY558_00930 [Euryarchaeota archaeon]|nr:hypothetical protein [Euryarchaeota archaeon]
MSETWKGRRGPQGSGGREARPPRPDPNLDLQALERVAGSIPKTAELQEQVRRLQEDVERRRITRQ